MNDLIEKLKQKDYVRAFGLMSKEEQECYEKVAPENCLYYSHSNSWKAVWAFNDHQTFAIKPDYQPEPEYVDLIVEIKDDILGILGIVWSKLQFVSLHEIPSMPDFEGFYMKGSDIEVQPAWVARHYKEGVIARLRK